MAMLQILGVFDIISSLIFWGNNEHYNILILTKSDLLVHAEANKPSF